MEKPLGDTDTGGLEAKMISREAPTDYRALLAKAGLPLAILTLFVLLGVFQPLFWSSSNIQNILRQISTLAIAAFAEAFPILVGGFDISIGSLVASISVVTAIAILKFGLVGGMLIGILMGAFMGTINGLVVTKLRVQPFIATLGMYSAARGLALLITDGQPIINMPEGFNFLGQGFIGPIPTPFVVAVVVFLICNTVLTKTRFGRYVYAIGGNEEASRLSGINVKLFKILAYTVCGVITAIAAIILSSRVNSGQPNLGTGLELDAIAAVVIGGVTVGGGRGKMWGVVLGVIVIGILRNGLNLLNVSSYVQMIIIGVVIVLAVVFDQLKSRLEGNK